MWSDCPANSVDPVTETCISRSHPSVRTTPASVFPLGPFSQFLESKPAGLMASEKAALDLISSANVSPTEHLLLKHFVENAVDSERAALYLVSRIGQGQGADHNAEVNLSDFKQDWRKLLTKCQ
jgi:hypothetical protein